MAMDEPSGVRRSTATDLMGYYLVAGLVGSPRMSLEAIDRRLAGFTLEEVLPLLSSIIAWADEQAIGDRRRQLQAADELFSPPVASRAKEVLRNDPEALLLSSQVAVNLAIRALATCPTEPALRSRPLPSQVGSLLLALGEHLGTSHSTPAELLVELTRLALFFSTNELAAWLEISRELLAEVFQELADHPDWIDLDDLMQDAVGMSVQRFWALTVIQGMHCRRGGHVIRDATQVQWNVGQDELNRWFDAWSLTAADAAQRADHDIGVGTGWSFTSVSDRPIIRLGNNDHALVRPSWLARKGLPAEFFWQLRAAFVDAGGDHEKLTRFFGAAIEEVGRRQLLSHLPRTARYYTEDDIGSWSRQDGKRCDALIVDEDAVIALDFVFRQFTRATAQSGELTDLALDLERAVIKKVRQIDASLALGAQTGHIPGGRQFPLVVVGAPFPVTPLLYSHVDETLSGQQLHVIGQHPECRPVMVTDLASLYGAVRVAGSGVGLADLLDEWLTSDLSGVPLRDWMAARRRSAPPDYTWGEFAAEQLGNPTFAAVPDRS